MAYVNDFIKIDIIGDCYEEGEIWNTGLKLSKTGVSSISEGDLAGVAEEVASEWNKFFRRSGSAETIYFSSSYRTTEVKASHIGTDGKVVGNTYTHFYGAPIIGTGPGERPAPQTAIVGSLRSDRQRGPGSQGRMYLPGLTYTIGYDGLMPEDETRLLANDFNAFINGVNDIADGIGQFYTVVLASPVRGGVEEIVTKTGVDRKVDTQRRRSNSLVSDYLTNVVPQ